MTRPLIWVGLFTLVCVIALAEQASAAEAAKATPTAETADEGMAETDRMDGPTTSAADLARQRAASEQFGSESDDWGEAPGIFKNLDSIEYLLTEDPDFVYFRDGTRNPMVIPWRRLQVIGEHRVAQAVELLDEGNVIRAEALLKQVVKQFPGTESAKIASDRLERINKDREAAAARAEALRLQKERLAKMRNGTTTGDGSEDEFPPEIESALIGIVSSGRPVVLIGDEVVPEGGTVKKNEEVKVKKINKNEVVFLFDDREFTIPLDALTTKKTGQIEFETVEDKGGGQ